MQSFLKLFANIFGLPVDMTETSQQIPDNILAFRTITSILSQLPRTDEFVPEDNLAETILDPASRKEIRISDAFCHLAACEHEITAMATNRANSNGPELSVTACTSQPPSSDIDNPGWIRQLWNITITNNAPRIKASSNIPIPTPRVVKPEKPQDLGDRSAWDYIIDIESRWVQPSFSSHLWILSNVLVDPRRHGSEGRSQLSRNLSRYIIMMSHKKMLRRIRNKTLSQPNIKLLDSIRINDIPKPPLNIFDSIAKSIDEYESDRRLMEDFVKICEKAANTANPFNPPDLNDPTSFTDRPLYECIPNLIKLYQHMPRTGHVEIYTGETCQEFHYLLVRYLYEFQRTLESMSKLEMDPITGTFSKEDQNMFEENLADIHRIAYVLMWISRGRAFRIHLENISSILVQHDDLVEEMDETEGEGEDEGDDGEEDELKAIEAATQIKAKNATSNKKNLNQSFIPWLRLMVGHFDAVEILARYVTSDQFPFESISLKLLESPPSKPRLLPWEKTLQNYLTSEADIPFKSLPIDALVKKMKGHMMTGNVYKVLQKYVDTAHCLVQELQQRHAPNRPLEKPKILPKKYCGVRGIEGILASMKPFLDLQETPNTDFSYLKTSAQTINDKLTASEDVSLIALDELGQDLERLSGRLHGLLVQYAPLLSLSTLSFKGTMHCEAYLATLLPTYTNSHSLGSEARKAFNSVLPDLKDCGPVIGVSKRCCPTCSIFLKFLVPNGEQFIVRGSHGTVSAVTLPVWTPTDIVDKMNRYFGAYLKKDLETLVNNIERQTINSRGRSKSTGSETLSLDSSEGSDRKFHPQSLDEFRF